MAFLTIWVVNKNIKIKISFSRYSRSWYFDISYVLSNFVSDKSKIFIDYSLASSLPPEVKILSILAKNFEKKKLNFLRSLLFHIRTWACLKYFVYSWLWKQFFASNSRQATSKLICYTICVIPRPYSVRKLWNIREISKLCRFIS